MFVVKIALRCRPRTQEREEPTTAETAASATESALIWSLTIDPVDPNILFAGTRPAAVYRSRDGGLRWEKLAVDIARECSIGIPFVTSVIVDPDDHRTVWAGVETMASSAAWTVETLGRTSRRVCMTRIFTP
jgi:hypothetical protein